MREGEGRRAQTAQKGQEAAKKQELPAAGAGRMTGRAKTLGNPTNQEEGLVGPAVVMAASMAPMGVGAMVEAVTV
jgi:hypothetical protein